MIYPFKRKNEMLFDPFVVPSTDPRSPIVCLPSRCVFVFRKEQFQIGIERMRSLFVFLFIVFHLLKIAKFVAHARLSQYVNPAKQLPCLCLSPSLTGQVHISPFLQKKLFRLSDRAFAQPSLASKISSVAVEPFYFAAFCSAVGLIPVFSWSV